MNYSIMPSRLIQMREAYNGLMTSGAPLVAQSPDGRLYPVGFGDDPGIYVIVPYLARLLGIPVEKAWALFAAVIIGLAVLVGIIGFFYLTRRPLGRFIAVIGMSLLGYFTWRQGDMYFAASCAPALMAPFLLAALPRWKTALSPPRLLLGIAFCLGLIIAASNFLRTHSATSVVLFGGGVVILLYKNWGWRSILGLGVAWGLGLVVCNIGIHQIFRSRDRFLKSHDSMYEPPLNQHVLWHQIYIGLGYLNNRYGIRYQDECAIELVRKVDPNIKYCSPQYEAVLQKEVIRLVRSDPFWFRELLGAKMGVILVYLLQFGNIGLLAAWKARASRIVQWPFIVAMTFSTIPPLLTIPCDPYLLGFAAWAALYGIANILWFLESREGRREGIP